MKLLKIGISLIFSLLLVSCISEESTPTSYSQNEGADYSIGKITAVTINSGIYGDNLQVTDISNYHSYGWDQIVLTEEFGTSYQQKWNAANSAGYSPKYAQIWRPYAAEGSYKDTSKIKDIIDEASDDNADYIYIDDFLTIWAANQADSNRITKETIDMICNYADSKGLDVAVSEDCVTAYIIGHLHNEWDSLFTNIDIIMPYGYAGEYNGESMYNHLYNFYYYLTVTRGKNIIPILGYNVLMGGVRYSQLGAQSAHTGFIERALDFAYESKVFYYYEGDITKLEDLTGYLQYNDYISGWPIP